MHADREIIRSGELNRLLEEVAAARAERRLQFDEGRRINELLQKLLNLHRAEFPAAVRPIAPSHAALDEAGVLRRHMSAAKNASSVFDRSGRSAALEGARRAAEADIARLQIHNASERQRSEEKIDAWWNALLSNEPITVLTALAAAFEDNEAAAAAVGLDGDELTVLVVVPGQGAIPAEHPSSVDLKSESVTMAPIAADDRAALYMSLVAGHAVVTVKEALAVAPAVQAVRVVAVRRRVGWSGAAEALLAARFERTSFSDVDWSDDGGALKILYDNAGAVVINPGPSQMLMPIDLAREPELGAVVDVVTFTDEVPQIHVDLIRDPGGPVSTSPMADDVVVTEFDALRAAAQHAQQNLERGRGIAEQIAAGDWDADLTPEQARDLGDSLAEIAETLRAMRSTASETKSNVDQAPQWSGILPFNRKERFFTGTVFPGLVASTGFWHVQRLLDVFDVPATAQGGEFAQVQLLTEYGFAESVYTGEDKAKWGESLTRETPDIVIAGTDWVLAIEAKMYHSPSAAALNEQMAAQAPIIHHWRDVLDLPADRVVHALLLPDRLAQRERAGLLNQHVVTWEALLSAYQNVGPRYWVSVLADALDRHPDLESRAVHLQNAEAVMTGAQIVDDAQSALPTVGFVGRAGGSAGARFAADVHSGNWSTQKYQVRATAVSATNRNWMPVTEFLSDVGAMGAE